MRVDYSCVTGSSPCSKVCTLESVSEWSKLRKMTKLDEFQFSRGHHVTNHFRKKTLFFRDTRDHPEHDAKNRLSLPSPSSEKPLAEIDELKNNRPKFKFRHHSRFIPKLERYVYHSLPKMWVRLISKKYRPLSVSVWTQMNSSHMWTFWTI